jgi:hypothetical protein
MDVNKTDATAGSSDPKGTEDLIRPSPQPSSGICEGTFIKCQNNHRRVESLKIGDRILTRDAGYIPLARIELIDPAQQAEANLIRVSAGTLNAARPLFIYGSQLLLLRHKYARPLFGDDEVLVHARLFQKSIYVERVSDIKPVYRLWFDQPHLILANNVWVECPVMFFDSVGAASELNSRKVLTPHDSWIAANCSYFIEESAATAPQTLTPAPKREAPKRGQRLNMPFTGTVPDSTAAEKDIRQGADNMR